MKAIPIITAVLICQTMFLTHVLRKLGWLYLSTSKISEFDPQSASLGHQWFQLAISSCFGLMFLSLVLIVVIWRKRLCHRWLLFGITLLWALMVFSSFPGNVH